MKISLTTQLDCRHVFKKGDGGTYAFPGQDFEPIGNPRDFKKCRKIYKGPDIIDKLDCESIPSVILESSIYSDTSSGRSSESPPSESVSVPEEIGCCNLVARSIPILPFAGSVFLVEIRNEGTCDLVMNVTSGNENYTIFPDAVGIVLAPGAIHTVECFPLELNSESTDVPITITTNVCPDYVFSIHINGEDNIYVHRMPHP